jgi:hypothetical protein
MGKTFFSVRIFITSWLQSRSSCNSLHSITLSLHIFLTVQHFIIPLQIVINFYTHQDHMNKVLS